jgi:hypothetical protein
MRKRRNISSKLDYKRKERYKEEKDVIHKKKEEEKPVQKRVK